MSTSISPSLTFCLLDGRYQALTRERDLLNSRWDEQNALLVQSHERVIQDLTEEYEQKLQEEQVPPLPPPHPPCSVYIFVYICIPDAVAPARAVIAVNAITNDAAAAEAAETRAAARTLAADTTVAFAAACAVAVAVTAISASTLLLILQLLPQVCLLTQVCYCCPC